MLSRNIVTCDDTTTVKRGYSYSYFFHPWELFRENNRMLAELD